MVLLTIIAVTAVIAFNLPVSVAYAAEEETEGVSGEENKDVFKEVFQSEIVKNASTFIVSVIGSLAGLICVIGKIKTVGLEMKTAIKRCSDGDASVEKTTKELIAAKKTLEETAKELQKQIEETESRMSELRAVAEESEKMRKADAEKIRHMLQLGFCNDVKLVKSGKAAKIFEVNNEKEE